MRSFYVMCLVFSLLSCKKEENTFRVPLLLEEETFLAAIDANTGLYAIDISVRVVDIATQALVSEEYFADSLILLSRNAANHIEFLGYEFAFNEALNTIALYEESKPLLFESLDNDVYINRILQMNTQAGSIEIHSEESTANGEKIEKIYTGFLF